ncbi:Lrp/AsnC family transcriptional regulator [Reinekea sp.]|jgi:Lrp/AsnC family leucine-responsive transcriptional regulator|uniref:Lrp/AsnC family transcriptional regulator n=1 Tax=Reinekea sp. TaxID=1970455 RepID=UPI002A835CFC|nr:Lrp/AsnC family transcriptional regulator [Reinekea sp.]
MGNTQPASVDGFDRKILAILQRSNRITSDHIAEQVGLSPAAVQRRIKRMREQNVIQADIAVVNAKAVGRGVTLIVQVTLERERADLLDTFKKDMKANPAVQQCYYVTGSADFMLVVTATDMENYEAFTRDVFFGNRNIRSFLTNVVMDSVKVELSVPVILEEN